MQIESWRSLRWIEESILSLREMTATARRELVEQRKRTAPRPRRKMDLVTCVERKR
jgi:hypothetical protein